MLGTACLSLILLGQSVCFILQLHKNNFKCLKQMPHISNHISEVCKFNISLPPSNQSKSNQGWKVLEKGETIVINSTQSQNWPLFSRKTLKWAVIVFKIFTFLVFLQIQIMLNKIKRTKYSLMMESLTSSKPCGLEKQKPCIHYIVHNRPNPELEYKKGENARRELNCQCTRNT